MDTQAVIELFKQQHNYLSSGQLSDYRVHTSLVRKMVDQGQLEQVKRGLYRLPAKDISDEGQFTIDYFDAAIAVPKGIFCLTTALHLHELTTQRPIRFDMAIPRTQRSPQLYTVSMRYYRFQEPYYSNYVDEIQTKKAVIKIYCKEKSICDAFRLRRIIGEDVGMESLNTYLRQSRKDINKLLTTARFCKVNHIIEPVVKAMVGI